MKVSNSELQTFKDCNRKWWLAYYRELGLTRTERSAVGPRELGSRFHTVLHAMYTDPNCIPMEVLNDLYDEDAEMLKEMENGEDLTLELRKEQDLAHSMLTGFIEWREETGLDYGLEMIAAETVLEVEIPVAGPASDPQNVMLRGKLDQRWIRKIDGARLFRDWKTVASLKDPTLPLNEQMKFYHLLEFLDAMEKAGGKEPEWRTDGALYTMIKKSKRTQRATPPFFDQIEIHHNTAELRSMWKRTMKTVADIVATRNALDNGGDPLYEVPPRPSKDCSWKCDFFMICGMFDDGSNVEGLIAERYTHLDPHERYAAQDAGKEVTE